MFTWFVTEIEKRFGVTEIKANVMVLPVQEPFNLSDMFAPESMQVSVSPLRIRWHRTAHRASPGFD